jgi:mycothiol synthase
MSTWRPLSEEDANGLSALDAARRKADGDDPISQLVTDALRITKHNVDDTLCAETGDGRLVAVGWIEPLDGQRLATGGCVHPDFRRAGMGSRLLDWAEQRAGALAQPGDAVQLVVTNEVLSEGAQALYVGRGFEQVMAEEMWVYDLTRPVLPVGFPEGITLLTWSADTVDQFFQAYHDSFRDRPSFPNPSAAEWVQGNLESEGFRPDLSWLACYSGEPAGFLTADVFSGLGWISQVGVTPAWRGKGLARALMVKALNRFKASGLQQAALHVNINNPTAINLYSRLGFTYRLTRARYVKEIVTARPFKTGLRKEKRAR